MERIGEFIARAVSTLIVISMVLIVLLSVLYNINWPHWKSETKTKQVQTPKICTFFGVAPDGWARGNVYFGSDGDKLRVDIEQKNLKKDATKKDHIIINSKIAYFWNEQDNKGIKFPVKETPPDAFMKPEIKLDCQAWAQEAYSYFQPPTNIDFKLASKDEVLSYLGNVNRF
jgi:hypothetical protein